MNPGLLTCEASALPLTNIPAVVSQPGNNNNSTKTRKRASALPLSYIPDDVSQFVFPTCLVKQARQKKNKQTNKQTKNNLEITTIAQKQQILHNTMAHAQKKVEILGFEPGASHMRSERSTTELYPR